MTVEKISAEIACAVLLAAGAGSRFRGDGHKLLAPLRGRPVFDHALRAAQDAGFDHVIVVGGAIVLDVPAGIILVRNERWSEGLASSLHVGLDKAAELGAGAVVVGLGDQPFVTAEGWRAVALSRDPIAVATYAGARGNPVRLHRSVWHLLPREGDHGARSLIAARPELVGEIACSGSPADIDTMEDLRQWNSSTNSQ